MEICALLGIRHGVVVLTKIDMVDEEWLALVEDEVGEYIRGTFLEEAPVVPVSAVTGEGLADFVKALDRISENIPARTSSGLFRLPVDRVFSMKGFGTVITGTLASGKVAVGDRVMLYPSGDVSKVRGLQVHNESVSLAEAGMRTAINFQGLDRATVERGDVVASPDALMPSYMVDVVLNYLSSNSRPLKNRGRVRFHTGTGEIMGVVVLLDREELAPGDRAIAQMRLDTPVTLVKDDRYVLRSYSPTRTIGGGWILNPIAPKHKRNRPELNSRLESLAQADPEQCVLYHIEEAGFRACSFNELLVMANVPEKQLDRMLQTLMSQKEIIQIDKEKKRYIHQRAFAEPAKSRCGQTGRLPPEAPVENRHVQGRA
jgi:selenocysteine-specific elongation factor